jgi:hypothetical protein
VGASLLAMAICQATGIFGGVHIHFCGNGCLWFPLSGVFLALAGGWAIRNARYFFSVTGPRVCGVVFVSRKMSITYRGSAYEQFWDTYFFATVARTLRGDSGWLRQSAASATRCAATATGSYLSDFRKHRCAR